MYKVDLNCDLGESFGNYTLGLDSEVLPFITSANVACGFHAADPVVMEKTVRTARQQKVSIGAHPGFPDLAGFGRRNMSLTINEARTCALYQIGALYSFCKASQIPLTHVKLHGAFYNMAGENYDLARAVCEGIKAFDEELIFLALSGSQMIKAAADTGLPHASEVFADRAYNENGTLVSRQSKGAVIKDEALAVSRVIQMIKSGTVEAINGKIIPIKADSICVHGDGEKALTFVKKIKKALTDEGISLKPLPEIIS